MEEEGGREGVLVFAGLGSITILPIHPLGCGNRSGVYFPLKIHQSEDSQLLKVKSI